MAGVSSNPNSPRQKMINLMYLVFIAMMALNVSSEVLDGFELVEGSLRNSIKNATQRNKQINKNMEEAYSKNMAKVEKSYNNAREVSRQSDELYDYIEGLKKRIVQAADGKDGDLDNIKHKDDLEAASTVMLAPIKGEGKKLRENIDTYRTNLIELSDPQLTAILESTLETEPPYQPGLNIRTWENALFENMPVAAAITLLTKIQSDVRYAEGEVLNHLQRSIGIDDFRANILEAQVIPVSQMISQGTNYEARIVLSAVDSTQRPTIFIDTPRGKEELPAESKGVYTVPTGSLGKQSLTGSIKTHDGIEYPFTTEYYVTERTATVSPVKMNVLYAEYDNELSIAVPGVPSERVSPSISQGTIRRNGNLWIARPPSGVTEANVVVNTGGFTFQTRFRVLPLPDPISYLDYTDTNGNPRKFKGGMFSKRSLMEAEGILAGYDDGLLDVEFSVVSFTMFSYDSFGNMMPMPSSTWRFTEQQKNAIRNYSRGQRFYISDVKVTGGGRTPSDASLPTMEIIVN